MKRFFLIILFIFLLLQFIQPSRMTKNTDPNLDFEAPPKIKQLLHQSCYDCHSFETKWPFYSYIAPFSLSIAQHVEDGRASLNFSIWKKYPKEKQDKLMQEIFRTVYVSMPLRSYVLFHSHADLTSAQRKKIRDWILSQGIIVN